MLENSTKMLSNIHMNKDSFIIIEPRTTFPDKPIPGMECFVNGVNYVYTKVSEDNLGWFPTSVINEAFVYTQENSALKWTVAHNFNLDVNSLLIVLYDSLNKIINDVPITQIDKNTIEITHATATSGFAHVFVNPKLSIIGAGEAEGSGGSGLDGKSAYELYVTNLQEGETPLTEIEWLDSLKGEDGAPGKSAYELYLETVPQEETPLTETEWLNSFNINNNLNVDASTLTEGQLDYLRDKQLSYGTWRTINIGTLPFTLTSGVTRMPIFRNAIKEGNLVNNDDYSITLKKGMLYRFEFFISCQYSTSGQYSYRVVNSDTDAIIEAMVSDTVTSTAHRGPLDQMHYYFKFDEDTRIEIRPLNSAGNITALFSMRVQIVEISSVDMKLARFKINGKSFDENNNIDLEGLSTLSNPKLNEEVLTERRHPVSGKPLYTKTIDFGTLPNNTTKSVTHNVLDVEDINVVFDRSYVYIISNPSLKHPVIYTHPTMTTAQWNCSTNATNISIATGMDRTSLNAIITIEYTKTTDTVESPVRLVGGGFKYTESDTEPENPSLGDEWHNTTNDILYKRRKKNGVLDWYEI